LASNIELIAGLGNPGSKYEDTRHNVGFWFLDALSRAKACALRQDSKFQSEVGKFSQAEHTVWLIKPMTYMNLSGQAIIALANYYKIAVENILVVHDELDLPPGVVRLKKGGGHGGHNGLRDLIAHANSNDFMRLRIGIGHPGSSREVTDYVLGTPSSQDRQIIIKAIDEVLPVLPMIIQGEFQKAMHKLHTQN